MISCPNNFDNFFFTSTRELCGEWLEEWQELNEHPSLPWASAPGGHVPTLKIIWVGIANPEFSLFEIVWVRTPHPGFCAKHYRTK